MARKTTETLTNLMDFYKRFPDEQTCREYLFNERFPDGKVVCMKCGSTEKIYNLADGKRYKCGNCKHIFTVTVGTVFEASHIPLQKWFLAIYLVSAHKKGISSLQLHRDISVTQKTAWFMLGRIRYMLSNGISTRRMNGTVECDETYVGGKHHKGKRGRGSENKTPVFGMVERQGEVRAIPVENVKTKTLQPIIEKNIAEGSTVMTDELPSYNKLDESYEHKTVNHGSKEYVREEIHTQNIDNFWSLLKRGIIGIYHSTSEKHLHRYVDEFQYRHNTRKIKDGERFKNVMGQSEGRLKYKELIA
jgi:transposase-like protein